MLHSIGLALLQTPIESSPLIVALVALLAYPSVTSALTGILKTVSGKVPPETVVYIASLLLTGAAVAMAGDKLPIFNLLDPVETVGAWLLWAKANSSSAQMVYDILKKALGLIPSAPAPMASAR